jgi:DNA repair protein SbcC/Rad50
MANVLKISLMTLLVFQKKVVSLITFDYELIRNEGDKKRKFVPKEIPKELDNLVYIEGPNSSGKSTLLHIIALGLHGVKNVDIPKSLRRKMESLLDTEYQQLSFNFSIDVEGKELISEKSDKNKNEIKLYEKVEGKKILLTPDTFLRKYNLIYDIPINPTSRLSQMTRDIQSAQFRYGGDIGELKAYVIRLLQDIKQSRDPKRIEELRDMASSIKNKINVNVETIRKLEEEFDYLEKYVYVKYYLYYKDDLERIQKDIRKEKSRIGKVKRKKSQTSSEYNTRMIQARQSIHQMKAKMYEVTDLLRTVLAEDEDNHLHIWKRIDLDDTLMDFYFDDALDSELTHFYRVLKSQVWDGADENTVKEAHMYQYLLSVLNEFSDLDVELPGGKNITEFIKDLLDKKKNYDHVLKRSKNIENTLELLDQIHQMKKTIENDILPDLRKLKEEQPDGGDEYHTNKLIDDKINELLREETDIKHKYEFYEKGWINKGKLLWEDIQSTKPYWIKYTNYTESQLRNEIKQCERGIVDKKSQLETNDDKLKRVNYQLSMLEDQKEHPYREYYDKLTHMKQKLDILDQKINLNYKDYISEIIKETAEHSNDEDKENYYSAIFTYLGQKIGFIRHLSEEYEVKYVDLIDQQIITFSENDVDHIIRFQDMGTGQSQSTYLLGKLDSSDNRQIIALFDEIAMMDSKSLKPIYKRFKQLYSNDELLAGIVVQRGDAVNVKPID